MKLRPDRVLQAAYRDAPRGDRLHVRVRWTSCPFQGVLDALPNDGELLDLGCGHGVLPTLVASRTGMTVHGIDIDPDKIEVARIAARRAGLPIAYSTDPEEPFHRQWSAITIIDVLYLLGEHAAVDLVSRAARAVAPGGRLVVKEMADRPRWKARLNTVQENLATRVLRITEGDTVEVVPIERLAHAVEASGLAVDERRIDRWYPHPHTLLVGRRPA